MAGCLLLFSSLASLFFQLAKQLFVVRSYLGSLPLRREVLLTSATQPRGDQSYEFQKGKHVTICKGGRRG
ncbi:hypothetical protein CIPAW_08G168800 [Carya illinoinensis]|uniref:Secreted protein n=1 Tax=Carya illinoinensis TaxID=32201 RepID=A0A8T1PSK5_CARIL|nr:hypothetical protein CIPAW_08G168800 [Carya illinoinensis]